MPTRHHPGGTVTTAPPFAYFGGKGNLAARIVGHLPSHRHYVEPFAGSLAVLLAKNPAPFETVNDLDGRLMTFWRVLRDRGTELAERCYLTPHSRSEHDLSYDLEVEDELEMARRIWVRLTQGRGGTMRRTGWRHFQNPGSRSTTSMPDYLEAYVERMAPAIDRLRRVSLESRPAVDLVKTYGRHAEVCLYVDPPYLGETRSVSSRYGVEMHTPAQHEELAAALLSCAASVVISGYPSDLYDAWYSGWHRVELAAFTGQANLSAAEGRRTEVLWSNRPLREQAGFVFGDLAPGETA
jgi:DNA adenine methylase